MIKMWIQLLVSARKLLPLVLSLLLSRLAEGHDKGASSGDKDGWWSYIWSLWSRTLKDLAGTWAKSESRLSRSDSW